jgi:hypothetical protein
MRMKRAEKIMVTICLFLGVVLLLQYFLEFMP